MELLERDGVLQDLFSHLAKAAAGRGRLVLLAGEAGIGKTAVVRRLGELAETRARVLIGACDPLDTPSPLKPLMDIATGIGPALQQALKDTPPAQRHAVTLFHQMLDDLSSSARPTLLVVEDVHWADEATLDLLRYLARRIPALPVLVVVTYRDDELSRTHPMTVLLGDLAAHRAVHRYRVDPLSQQAIAHLAVGRPVDVERLHRVTGGNPFFVTEILAADGAELPATVRQAVLARLARLPRRAFALVEAMAVIGSPAAFELVAEVVPEVNGAIVDAQAQGIVHTDTDTIAFRHELVRITVRDEIPAGRRIALHQRVLAVLQARPITADDLARLAFHAEQAQADDTVVLRYAQAAAEHAAALGAHSQAEAQYARALRHATALPTARQAALWERRAFEGYLSDRIVDSITAWQQALQLRHRHGNQLRTGDALRWISRLLYLTGHNTEARQAGLKAVQILTAIEPSPELAWAYVNLCRLAAFAQEDEAAAAYASLAIELAGRFGEDEAGVHARFYAGVARLLCTGEGWQDLEGLWHQALEAGWDEYAGLMAIVLSWLATVLRDLERATAIIERFESYCLDHDFMSFLQFLRGVDAFVMAHRGQWDKAVESATAVLSHPDPMPMFCILPLTVLALVRARRGEPGVWTLLDQALGLVESTDLLRLAPVWAARAEAAWLAGDDARAVAEAERGLATASPHSIGWLTGGLVCWVRCAGGTPAEVPVAPVHALQLAGDWAGAARAWERAGCPYDAALARLDGDAEALSQALATFEALGARPAVERTRARLRALGVRPGPGSPRAATRANPQGLTSREMEVLKLLGEGLSDAQIADLLILSRRTVSHHVSAILAKLKVRTRHDAVRRLIL